MRVIALLVGLACSLYSCQAIYKEQKGEFDWKIQSIGFISNALELRDSGDFIVLSEDRVISRIDKRNGDKKWREILPEGYFTTNFDVTDRNLFVTSCAFERSILSVFDLQTGRFIWDYSSDLIGNCVSDLAITSNIGGLALIGSSIMELDDLSGLNGPKWTWDAVSDYNSTSYRLYIKSVSKDKRISGSNEIAYGCLFAKADHCEKIAKLKLSNGKIFVEEASVGSSNLPIKSSSLSSNGFWSIFGDNVVSFNDDGTSSRYLIPQNVGSGLASRRLEMLSFGNRQYPVVTVGNRNFFSQVWFPTVEIGHDMSQCNVGVTVIQRSAKGNGLLCVSTDEILEIYPNSKTSHSVVPSSANINYVFCGMFSCLFQTSSGLMTLVGMDGTPKWSQEQGLVHVKNIIFADHNVLTLDNDLDEELLFKRRLLNQLQVLPSQVASYFQAPTSVQSWVERLMGKQGMTSRRNSIPWLDHKQAFLLCGNQLENLRLAAIDAFSGSILWLITLPSPKDYVSGDIEMSHIVLHEQVAHAKEIIITVVAKDSTGKSFSWNVPISRKGPSLQKIILESLDFSVESIQYVNDAPVYVVRDSDRSYVVPVDKTWGELSHPVYFHSFDSKSNALEILKLENKVLMPSSVTQFSSGEKVVSVSYPDATSPTHSSTLILGDDSVLTKYLNPHLIAVATVSSFVQDYSNLVENGTASALLNLYLLDRVSGRVIHRMQVENAAGPVHTLLVENNAVVIYWNVRARRTELVSISLFEGIVDKYELHPFSQSPVLSSKRADFSSFTHSPPLAMHKTFVLPQAVLGITQTHSKQGITSKHLLLALSSGQLYSLDMRQISPRRPTTEPTAAEKEEGILQYSPFLHLHPLSFVSLDESMEYLSSDVLLAVGPTLLESSSALISQWGGLDLFGNLLAPSQGYDTLSPDFNHSLLVTILVAIGIAVFVLRNMAQRKKIDAQWQ